MPVPCHLGGRVRHEALELRAEPRELEHLADRVDVDVLRGLPVDAQVRDVGRVVDAIDKVAMETGKSVPQIALNWLLRRPTVSSVIIGARNEEQLRQNLAAAGWALSAEQVALLDKASQVNAPYPYWHQRQFDRNPTPVTFYK